VTLSGGTLTINRSNAYALSNSLSGSGAFSQIGSGTTTLSGTNTSFTGTTTVSNGTLTLGNATALGSGAATISGGTLNLNSQTIANTITVSGGTLSGGTIALSQVTASSGTISAILTGATALTKSSTGTLTLSGANTYSLGTTISGGTLQVGAGGTTGSLGSGAVTLSGGALTINRSNDFALSNGITGTGSFTQSGFGTTTLSGTNTFTGAVTVANGTLVVASNAALGDLANAVTVAGNANVVGTAGGTLVLAPGAQSSLTSARTFNISGRSYSQRSGSIVGIGESITLSGTVSTLISANDAALVQIGGLMTLSGTVVTGTSTSNLLYTGSSNMRGAGSYAITGTITGAGVVYRANGQGTMIFNPSDASGFSGVLRSNAGTYRFLDPAKLGTNVATGTGAALYISATSTMEFRSGTTMGETVSWGKALYLGNNTTGTLVADHALGSSAINQINAFSSVYSAGTSAQNLTLTGRNGAGFTFTGFTTSQQAANGTDVTVTSTLGAGTSTIAGDVLGWDNTNTVARTFTAGVAGGDLILTGSILAAEATNAVKHALVKTGLGTLTIQGVTSTITGDVTLSSGGDASATTGTSGTTYITDFRSLGTTSSGVIKLGNATTTTGSLTIGVAGTTPTVAGLTTSRVISINTTTKPVTINASQPGANPVVISSNFTGVSSATARTLFLGGSNTADNLLSGVLPDITGVISLTKKDAGTWALSGANTYTGATTITGGTLKLKATAGASNIIASAAAVTFDNNTLNYAAGGTLELVALLNTATTESLGALTPTAGMGTVKLTGNGFGGTANLIFSSLAAVNKAAAINFDTSSTPAGSVTFTTAAASSATALFGDGHVYVNGTNFAYSSGTSNVVIAAPTYGVTSGFVNAAAGAASLTSLSHNFVTGAISAQTDLTISSLKLTTNNLTLASGQTLTIQLGANGEAPILQSGGTATIAGGAGITSGGSGALVFRVNGATDILNLDTPMLVSSTGGFTKSGLGTLVLNAVNAETTGGAINILEGTVKMAAGSRIGATGGLNLIVRTGATLDLNGTTQPVGQLDGTGSVTNSSATDATLTMTGGNVWSGSFTEGSTGKLNVTRVNSGNTIWNGLSTNTGVMTFNITTTKFTTVTTLADIGVASSIGKGDATSTASNAASLVFTGDNASGLAYAGLASVSTNRLFTLNSAIATPGAAIANNSSYNAALVFSNTGAIVFGAAANAYATAQTLTLTGSPNSGTSADNYFGPKLTNNAANTSGTTAAQYTALTKSGTSIWVLGNTANDYSGTTTISGGVLNTYVSAGSTLSASSPLFINGGQLQTQGEFTRSLAASAVAGSPTVTLGVTASGFSAGYEKLTVAIGGTSSPTALTWGSGGFFAAGSTVGILLNSATSLAEVEFRNAIDLNQGSTNNVTRTITVTDNGATGTDFATISGVISNSTGAPTNGVALSISGGILRLFGANTYDGSTKVIGGTLTVNSLGLSTTPGVGTSVGTSTNANTSAGALRLGNAGTGGAIVQYVGPGETSDRLIQLDSTTGNIEIHADGSGPLVLSNVLNNIAAGAKVLYLRGINTGTNMVTSLLADNGGALGLNIDGGATWILSGANTLTGTVNINANAGVGNDAAFGTTGTLKMGGNGTIFAYGNDRTVATPIASGVGGTAGGMAFAGDYSLNFTGAWTFENTNASSTLTNNVVSGKTVSFTGSSGSWNLITNNRTLTFNGSGDTVWSVPTSTSTAFGSNITYSGTGSLTIGAVQDAFKATATVPALTVSSGAVRIGANNVLPTGATYGNTVMSPAVSVTATLDLNGYAQDFNGFTATSAGTSILDVKSTSARTVTFGYNDAAVSLGNPAAGTPATGTFTFKNSLDGLLSLTKTGTGTMTLNYGASLEHAGVTTVSAGTLSLQGPLIFKNTPDFTVAGGATLNLFNSSGQTWNVSGLNLGAGSGTANLGMELGSASNSDKFIVRGAATLANTVNFQLRPIGGFAAGSYDLVTADSGLNAGTKTVTLSSITSEAGQGSSYALSSTATAVTLTVSDLTGNVYWKGGVSNNWFGYNASGSNFTSDSAGLNVIAGLPGTSNKVIFNAAGQTTASQTVSLDGPVFSGGLVFNNATGSGPLTSITLNAAANAATTINGTLTLAPSASTDGIDIQTGAPAAVTISTAISLGANQTWNVFDSGTTLTASGFVTGSYGLTKDGAGTLVLGSGSLYPTYTGPTVIKGGTLKAGATTMTSWFSSLEIQSGATFTTNGGADLNIAALSGAGTVNNTHGSTGVVLYAGYNNADTTFSGTIVNGAAGTQGLRKVGSGVLTLNAASTASTATGTLAAYAGSILFDYSASSLTSMWTGTGAVFLYGGGLVWKANPSVAMNASLGALTSSAGANSLTIDPNGSTLLQVVTLSGSVTDSASGMSLLVTSPANTEIRLGSNYTATSGSAPRGKIVFTTGDGNFDFIKNAGATTASAAFTDYTLDPTPSAGATDTNTPKLTTSLALGGSWTTDKMKIQTSAAGQTLNIGAGNTLTLTAGGLIFQGADAYTITGGSIQGYTSVNSDLVAHVYGNGVLTLASNVTNGIGASVFTKAGPGTLNLTGQILSTGASYINQGVLNINAAQSITGSLTVLGGTLNVNAAVVGNPASTKLDMAASGSGGRTVVNVAADMTLFATTQGGERGSANAYNQTAGTVTVTPGNTGTQYVAAAYGYGYFNLTGGTYNISGSGNRFMATGGSSGLGVSVIKVGGTGFLDHTNAEWFLNYGNTSITVSDTGLIDHTGSTNAFALIMDSAARDMIGSLNVAGGTVKTGNQPIQVGNSATAGKSPGAQAFINLAKGTLSTGANLATVLPTANDAFIYFAGAGGTLKASNNLTNFLPATIQGATLNAVLYGAIDNQVGSPDFDGGLTVDTSGFDVAFSASLRAAAGVGITQADMTLTAGSGYVGAPLVRFSTTGMIPGGTPAQGYAIIDAALGTVTGIVITNPGTYVAGTVPKLDLIGGGGSGASVAFSGLSTANAAAGLTKVGNGKLTLNAANTYAGGTNVNAGTLALGGNEVLADTGAVTVGGGTLDLTSFVETAGIVTLDSGTITGTTGSLSSSSDFRLRSGTVSGILTGAGGIAKSTSGTVALSAGNTFSGTVSVAAGKLQFSADANLGNGSATNVVSVNGGTLAYTAASALTLSANRTIEFGPSHATIEVADAAGVLTLPGVRASSTGNLTKTGVGKLVLAGTTAWNSGANGVTVNAGTLQAGFGTGGVAAINVGAAGTLNFINSTAEVLTLGGTAGALTLAGGANLGFELGASGSNDKIVVGAGGTAVTAGNVTINLLTIAGFGAGTFDLLSAPSGLKPLGVVYSLGSAPSGYNYTINQTDTLVSLVVAAFVPRYWTNAQTGGSWATLTGGTASNWSTDTAGLNDYGATPGSADTVIFSATSLAGGALTTTLDGSYTIDGLQFINATSTATTTFLLSQGTGSGTLTIAPSSTSSGIVVAANAGAVTISAPINASTTGGAASQTWSIDGTGASSLTVTGNITIGAGINKTGAGTLTLSGTNTGSGGVTIGAGALHVGSANALGTGALTVGALTTFDNSSGSALTLANNATNWNGAFTFTGTNDLSFGTGGATLGQSLTATVAGRVLTVASVTDGAGSYDLTKAGAGTLTITGALTIGGAMSLNAGTLNIGTGGNMGAVTAASGTTLAMSGANTLASLIGTSATLTLSGANTISGVVTLNGGTLTASGNNPSIGGAVTINSGTATFSGNNGFASASLVTGSLTLSGTNTFVTGLSMAAGTLNLNSAGALGGGSLAISGGTLNNSSGSAKVLTGAGAGSVTGSFTFTGSSSLSVGTSSLAISGNPTFTISGSTLTFGGDVTGASTLTKTGTGGLSVTGGLTHDGGVTVLNGTLTVGASSSYTGATSIQASAAGAGTLVLSGTSTLTNAGNSLTMGSLSGTGGTRLDLSNGSASFNSLTVQTNHATANTIVIGTGQELNIGGGVTIGVNGAGATTTRLTISGAGTFSIGTPEDPTGAGFQLGAHTTSAFSNDATLTMSGLTAFYANLGAGTFKVGDPTNSGGAATAGSKLYLAKTSTIIASTITSDTQNGSVTNYVYLGDTANVFNATNLYVSGAAVDAGARTNGQISWDSGVTTGTFRLRGLGGGDATAITNINVAYGLGTSAYATTGLVDLAGHSSDILATTISIGGNSGGSGTPGHKTGTFTFDTGSLVATTVNLGARTGGFQIANTITGTLNLMASGGSGTATFTNLTMGLNSSSSTTSNGASVATLNIGGGTVGITGTLTMGNNSIVGTTAQTVAPVQATTNISGGTVTIGTLNMNLNSAANSGTNRASVAGLYITGGTTEITALSLANTSTGTAIATSTLSITAGTLTLGADLAYTRTLGTVNSTLTLNGGTLDMSDKAIGVAGALIGTLNLQSGTLKNVNQINDGAGFVKAAGAGSNTLIIDGTNSFSGTFTISSGTVQVGAGSTTGTLGTVSVTNNAALTFNRSDAATFSNVITGSGTLTKVGNGTLTLTGNNSFTGGTTITNGTITIGHASSLGTASVNVGALGTLNLGGFTIGNTIVLAEGATLTGGQVSASTAPTTGTLAVELTGSLPLEKTGSGRLELTGANTFSGATSVSNGTIAVSGFGNGSTASPLGITDLTDPSKLVIGGGATLEFTGSDPVTTTARSFTIADSGTIAATGTGALNFNGSSKIKLTGATPALTLSATSTTSVNRFDSALDGTDAISTLTIDGTGIWVIGGNANRFKGTATFSIAAGTTQGATLGFDSGSLGYSASSAINVGDNAVLRWSAGNDDDISGRLRIGTGDTAKLDIGGNDVVFASAPKNAAGAAITAGTIEKKGAGTLTIGGAVDSDKLAFNVPTGKLSVDGTVGNVNLTSSGTILGGGGTVGSVTTVAGSILSAGNSPGTLTIDGNLLLAASTILQWEVQDALDPAKYDQIHVTGNLDLTQVTNNNQRIIINVASLVGTGTGAGVDLGAPLNFNNPDTVGTMPRTFDFMRVDGAISFASGGLWNITNVFSFDLDDFQYTNGGSKDLSLWSISSEVRGNDTYIMITAVPEPSTYGFGLGALALAAAAIRRRRKNQAAKAEASGS
jgi:autotransporter-associated beta strand protein